MDIDVSVLCSHLQEEHCFDLKNAVCALLYFHFLTFLEIDLRICLAFLSDKLPNEVGLNTWALLPTNPKLKINIFT